MQEFLNPKSMLTPGIAGSLMMFLVNGIVFQFPEVPTRYLALLLSFLIAGVVCLSQSEFAIKKVEKGVYWVLNALVIFVVGFGSANLAADVTAGSDRGEGAGSRLMPFVSVAHAQPSVNPAVRSGAGSSGGMTRATPAARLTKEELEKARLENERLKRELEELKKKQAAPVKDKPNTRQYFKKW